MSGASEGWEAMQASSPPPPHSKRRSRVKVRRDSHHTATEHTRPYGASNRSSPEASPERIKILKPLSSMRSTTSGARRPSSGGHSGSRQALDRPSQRQQELQQTQDYDYLHQQQHQQTSSHTSLRTRGTNNASPSIRIVAETPLNERLAYFGSNESERGDLTDDEEGNASSSDDSATELLDQALGLQPQGSSRTSRPSPDEALPLPTTNTTPGRRDILVHRPVPEPHFASGWEQALLKPKKSSSSSSQGQATRARSLTPGNTAASIASRRRGSPSAPRLKHDDVLLSNAASGGQARSPTPVGSPTPSRGLPFRADLLAEVILLTAPVVLAAHRLKGLPTPVDQYMQPLGPIPISPLILLAVAIPCIALFRRRSLTSNYMFPFTDERGYRSPLSVDDGFAAGAVIPVILAAGFLWDVVRRGDDSGQTLGRIRPIMDVWQASGIVAPEGASTPTDASIRASMIVSRVSLLLSTSINSFILILHMILSRTVLKVERLPTHNTKRFLGALLLSSTVSFILWASLALNHAFAWASPYISPAEAAASSFIYQMSIYSVSRLVRRGFTLGELALATGAGVSLCLEFWRITLARFVFHKYGGVPATFRAPTPLVVFQHVIIPGAFLTGFLLAPLLVLSRNFAQMPSHRLKWPEERGRNRKLSALGILLGFLLVVCLPFGGWAGWQLGDGLTRAWIWGARFAIFGGDGVEGMHGEFRGWRRWRRVALSIYWLAIIVAAVGGWQTRLVRARRIRLAKSKNAATATDSSNGGTVNKAALEYVGVGNIREDKRTHVALDLRRKFFHALAVLMFVPAIAVDPAFTALAFSVAFAVFTFAEYARYFAVYPIGAPIHVFFNEFVDSKDAGPVILSHFYLLTGCAGGLWLEGRGIKNFTGVLAVGIGDAFASVLGKRLGRRKWPNSSKTLVGTFSFVLSIFVSAMALQLCGVVEPFSASRYLLATLAAGLLEATSLQNDNLVIPIFFWSLLSLLEV